MCLPQGPREPAAGTACAIAGWGALFEGTGRTRAGLPWENRVWGDEVWGVCTESDLRLAVFAKHCPILQKGRNQGGAMGGRDPQNGAPALQA